MIPYCTIPVLMTANYFDLECRLVTVLTRTSQTWLFPPPPPPESFPFISLLPSSQYSSFLLLLPLLVSRSNKKGREHATVPCGCSLFISVAFCRDQVALVKHPTSLLLHTLPLQPPSSVRAGCSLHHGVCTTVILLCSNSHNISNLPATSSG